LSWLPGKHPRPTLGRSFHFAAVQEIDPMSMTAPTATPISAALSRRLFLRRVCCSIRPSSHSVAASNSSRFQTVLRAIEAIGHSLGMTDRR